MIIDRDGRAPARPRTDPWLRVDEVAEHARRVAIVVRDVAGERARDHRIGVGEHVVQPDLVARLRAASRRTEIIV